MIIVTFESLNVGSIGAVKYLRVSYTYYEFITQPIDRIIHGREDSGGCACVSTNHRVSCRLPMHLIALCNRFDAFKPLHAVEPIMTLPFAVIFEGLNLLSTVGLFAARL